MNGSYLVTTYADKGSVKALGVSWDPTRKRWYVLPGHDMAPLSKWLPAKAAAPAAVGTRIPERADTHPATEVTILQ